MLQKFLLLWLILSSFVAAIWPDLFGKDEFDPFVASKPSLGYLIALIMLSVGTLLPADEVKGVFKRWPLVIGGTAIQYCSMPFLAWLIATTFGFTGELKVGIIMVGCVPGAMASNVLTMIARGNVSYSVGLTTSATLLSPLVVPLVLKLTLREEADAAFLLKSAYLLVIRVVIPVISGYLICKFSRAARTFASRYSAMIANLSILWIIAYVVASNRDAIRSFPVYLLLALLVINFGGYLAGQLGGRILRIDSGMRKALTLEVGMQNAGVGATLAASLFPDQPMIALPCVLFTFGCMTTGTILAEIMKRFPSEAIAESEFEEAPIQSA